MDETPTSPSNASSEESPVAAAPDPETQYLWQERQNVVDRAEISVRYHRARQRLMDLCDRFIKWATIVIGSAAALQWLGPATALHVAILAAILSAIALAFDLADRARNHAELAQRFSEVLARIAEKGKRDYTEEDIKLWDTTIRKIESNEPPVLPVVQCAAQLDYERSLGHSQRESISPFRFFFGQFLSIDPYSMGSSKNRDHFESGDRRK